MWRLLHLIVLGGLLGSAGYVYGVKYQSVYAREQLVDMHRRIDKEREQIALFKAEFASLIRPDRLQDLADRQLGMQPLALSQIARFDDLPYPGPKVDGIRQKIDSLGLFSGSTTPGGAQSGVTPAVR
jgi:cell division protein FtsL